MEIDIIKKLVHWFAVQVKKKGAMVSAVFEFTSES